MNIISGSLNVENELLEIFETLPLPVIILERKPDINGSPAGIYCMFLNSSFQNSNISLLFSPGLNIQKSLPSEISESLIPIITNVFESGRPQSVSLSSVLTGSKPDPDLMIAVNKYRSFIVLTWTDFGRTNNVKSIIKNLRTSNENLEEFAYIASHDLQEPLRMVTSFTQLLQKRYADKLDKDANEFIEYAVDGAKRMKKLIDNLLIYSRVETKRREWTEVDVSEVIQSIIEDQIVMIEESGARITFGSLPVVFSDKPLLLRLFTNLISNALKFRATNNPEIFISAERKETEWLFKVKDNGIGINKKYFETIFMIFKRLNSVSEYPGTGIGLAICKKIVKQLHGSLWLESKEGAGTTFYFTLPIGDDNEQ